MSRYRDELGRFARRPNSPSVTSSNTSSLPQSPLVVQNHFLMAENEEVHQKMLNDYLHPTPMATPACIMFPPNMPNLDFKLDMIQLLPTFHKLESLSQVREQESIHPY